MHVEREHRQCDANDEVCYKDYHDDLMIGSRAAMAGGVAACGREELPEMVNSCDIGRRRDY